MVLQKVFTFTMENTTEGLVEVREEPMVSSNLSTKQILRKAHFLNPTHSSVKPPFPKNPLLLSSSSNPSCEPKTVAVTLKGWRNQSVEWQSWVQHLEGIYGSVWKRARIYEAVISSTYRFQRDNDVIVGLAEKWCPVTNTFVFPWGEATITLEDMVVLGGYSVSGTPVFSVSFGSQEVEGIIEKLTKAKQEFYRRPFGSQKTWIKKCMGSGGCNLEHEAFLSLWLERFVFNDSRAELDSCLFNIAIQLAKGEVVALAPAVLASIYRDLGLLKNSIGYGNEKCAHKLEITLCSPFHLVQLWAWERFPAFQPLPKKINNGDPRLGLWENAKVGKNKNVRTDLELATNSFQWQPYSTGLHGLHLHKFYKNKEQWNEIGSNQDSIAYGLCLRVCELVGLTCIQQYNPHRVAMQFGLDQDIPCDIDRSEILPEAAWSKYTRPFGDAKVFVPFHFSKPGVSVRYLEWWNQAEAELPDKFEDPISNLVRRKRSPRTRSKKFPQSWTGQPVERITHEAEIRNVVRNGGESNDHNSEIPGLGLEEQVTLDELGERAETEARVSNRNVGIKKEEIGEIREMEVEEEIELGEKTDRICSSAAENGIGITVDHKGEIPSNEGEGSSDYEGEIPGLALEARIASLERLVATLKAKYF